MRYLSYVLLQSRVKKSHVLQYLKRLSDLQYVLFVFSGQSLSLNDIVNFLKSFLLALSAIEDTKIVFYLLKYNDNNNIVFLLVISVQKPMRAIV